MASRLLEECCERTKTIAENTKSAFAAAPINSEEQCQDLRNCEHVGSNGCIKHCQQNQKARFFKYMVDQAVWDFRC
jgi:hypothetical protein